MMPTEEVLNGILHVKKELALGVAGSELMKMG
jgi:hypothetical protein